ncbi:MAG: insulinase family protein [Alphaproteobacteria bacterium]|nr:MAG: insulinase family protein [Alphaproteobacteria bacterium]
MTLFDAKHYELKNGLKIVLIKKLSKATTIKVLYKIGTADDPEGFTGLSHFLEHMMFRGTKKHPGNAFNEKMTQIGGYINAFTSFDMTCYIAKVPSNYLEEILEMEADRMENLQFKQEDFDAELKAVEEEYGMRVGNRPTGPVEEVIFRNMYLYHPYGVLPIGYPHHIKAYTRENTFAWYKKWYHVNNATIIIAGDIDFEDTLKVIEKYFGKLKAVTLPERKRAKEPNAQGITRYIKQENERFASSSVEFMYEAPKKDYAYSFAQYMLGGGTLSLFYNHFVRKLDKGIQYVYTSYHFSLDDPGILTIGFDISPDKVLQDVVMDDYETYKKELLSGYLDSEEFKARFENAKKRRIGNLIHKTDGTMNAAENFISLGYGLTFDEINKQGEILEKITLEDVKKAMQDILTQKPKVVFIGVPKSEDKAKYSVRID